MPNIHAIDQFANYKQKEELKPNSGFLLKKEPQFYFSFFSQTGNDMVKMYRDHYVNIPMAEVLGRTFIIFLSPLIATFVNFL